MNDLSLAFEAISAVVHADIEHGFPSAQIVVRQHGRLLFSLAAGRTSPDGAPVTRDTLYDLASNTKMYATNYALQYLVSRNALHTDTLVADILGPRFYKSTQPVAYAGRPVPDRNEQRLWKSRLTLRHLLCHRAGLPADPAYHIRDYDLARQARVPGHESPFFAGFDGSERTRSATLNSLCLTPPMLAPDTQTLYSDADYMLLGFIIEAVTGKRLDRFLSSIVPEPLSVSGITFRPPDHGYPPDRIAATELHGNTRDGGISFPGIRTAPLQGEVHDEKAWHLMGGISGHAGLFASAESLASLAERMLIPEGLFTDAVIRQFTAPVSPEETGWGLGWWRQGKLRRSSYFSTLSPESAFGHQGWTGTLTMLDPEACLSVAVLTNKLNTPVIAPTLHPNSFAGSCYTTATLGFVPRLLYAVLRAEGLRAARESVREVLNELCAERRQALSRFAGAGPEHPAVLACRAVKLARSSLFPPLH